ncbi:MAG: DUF4134 domain-containing protein [Prevotella sp.]|jgi:hypothetical protein|nr:DUF4134 family protein [Prevotella sp. P4-98]MCI7651049.1 DUF4134 domain-containing protein [Prevotella sp.]MDY2633915.1 DUF4134 family protein [Prevotella sp.]OYP47834.1 hypothetical protein CIK96_01840 [Prevotella sp. P4-98]
MKKIKTIAKNLFGAKRMKTLALMLLCGTIATYAQNAAGDYTAGTDALATVTEEIAKYVPFVVKLCYAIAGVVAVVGAISVYIAMNNEEQDVKNILVLQNWLERIRKEVTNKVLSIKRISDFLIFPILAQPTLKKI